MKTIYFTNVAPGPPHEHFFLLQKVILVAAASSKPWHSIREVRNY